MTEQECLKILSVLTAAFPANKVSRETIQVYTTCLNQLDYEHAKRAVYRIIETSQFFPSIAEIKKAADKFELQLPEADEAWAEVMQQISKTGFYGAPKWSCEAVRDSVKAIGWRNICLSENIGIERAHFMKMYDAMKKRQTENKINQKVLQLVGGMARLPEGQ